MFKWGPDGRNGAIVFSFDNMGEAADLELGHWPADRKLGSHSSVYETLPFLLDTMAEYGISVSFFIEAWNVDHYPDAVRAIAEAGHEINSHGYRHESWFKLGEAAQVETLRHAHERYVSIGIKPMGFRPPGGISSSATENAMVELDYSFVSPTRGGYGMRGDLAVIPAAPETSDVAYYTDLFRQFRNPRAEGATDCATFLHAYQLLLDSIAEHGDIRSPVCHVTTPLETSERRDTFRRLIEMTLAEDRLWTPTASQAAEWMRSRRSSLPQLPLDGYGAWDPRAFWDENKGYRGE